MNKNIKTIAIEDKMKDSYLNYSLSVIVGRALPDARDGLKPVHRRILYAAQEMGLTHEKNYKKSARIVGEVLGKFHPHGDAAVYDAMVKMAQDFNHRYLLINGHGNFGSIDGDNPAAMRYTEVKLSELSEEILSDINFKTVEFKDNFDASLEEPVVLPSKIPNLLINGASGIAVGMSTDIPSHNLVEVINALIYLIKHPSAKLSTIMNYIPGPDFPTGGIIIGKSSIKEAYKTGHGKIVLRAKFEIEKINQKEQIVITEIPYQINKSKLLEEIAEMINKGKIENIADLRDESDKDGIRIIIELKKNADSELILNRLYKYTSLQSNYRINMLALVDNNPIIMNLITILNHFIEFRRDIITRRTRFKLTKAQERYHYLEGLIKAIDELDLVISIIRKSKSREDAKKGLINKLFISENQAKAILEMQLQRLVGMEIIKLQKETNELKNKIKKYQLILDNKEKLDTVLKDELLEIKKKHGDKRRTEIIDDDVKAIIKNTDLIKEKEAILTLSYRNNLKRTTSIEYTRPGKNDYILYLSSGTSLDPLLFFTQKGDVYTLPIHKIPEHHGLSTGNNLSKHLQIPLNDKIISVIALNEKNKKKYICIATSKGLIKKTRAEEYITQYKSIKAIKLKNNDKVIDVKISNGKEEIILGSKKGQTIRFSEESISNSNRNTIGKMGIKLEENDELINMNFVKNNKYLVSISENSSGKKTNILEFKPQNRNGKGLKTLISSSNKLIGLITANEEDILLLSSTDENLFTIRVSDIIESQRTGNLFSLFKKDIKINSVFKLPLLPENTN